MKPLNRMDMAMAAAVSVALADPWPDDDKWLTSIAHMARAVFGAAAASILLLDQESQELVFTAVSAEGEELLVGTRFQANQGIVGWTLVSGEPMAVDGLAGNQLFARDLAEATGYVPNSIMVVPVIYGGDVLGLLEVLDPRPRSGAGFADLDLLMRVGEQAGLSLHSLTRVRTAQEALASGGAQFSRLAALVWLLLTVQPDQRAVGLRLVAALHELLAGLVATNGDPRS